MIVVWVTLLLLHQGYALVPVTTVQLGEPATFTCVYPYSVLSNAQLIWYKQSTGDTLKLIAALKKHVNPVYGPDISTSRVEVKVFKNISSLTILRTVQEDEGMYHCIFMDWLENTSSATYLSFTGNTQRTSNYKVVQWPTVSDPVRPGDPVTLQCSVLSDSENKTCSGDHNVYWFKTNSDKSHPNIIYTDGNRHDECDKRSDTQKSCVYHFSKTVSSSDAGTYYCAVATCGEILFGDGTKVEIGTSIWSEVNTVIFLLCAVLVISLIVIAFLTCTIKKKQCDCCNAAVALQKNSGGPKSQQRDENTQVYSAVVFVTMKTDCGAIKDAKAAARDKIYAAVKAFGLEK